MASELPELLPGDTARLDQLAAQWRDGFCGIPLQESTNPSACRRTDFDHMLRLGWITPAETIPVRFGTSRAGAVDVALYTTAAIDALPTTHPDTDWQQLRHVGKGQRSPLAALQPTNPTLIPA